MSPIMFDGKVGTSDSKQSAGSAEGFQPPRPQDKSTLQTLFGLPTPQEKAYRNQQKEERKRQIKQIVKDHRKNVKNLSTSYRKERRKMRERFKAGDDRYFNSFGISDSYFQKNPEKALKKVEIELKRQNRAEFRNLVKQKEAGKKQLSKDMLARNKSTKRRAATMDRRTGSGLGW